MRIGNRYIDSIQCPLNLDSLIMSDECTPEFIEENLKVGQDIMWDAIRLSTCQYWLLKLENIAGFSTDFRDRIYNNLPAFSRMNRKYFHIKVSMCSNDELKEEVKFLEITNGQIDEGLNLLNPMNMLSNDLKDYDKMVIEGKITLRKFILERIREFLKTGNKDTVDFSYSLFLPEILSPKFFMGLSEAEHIVILGNLDRYFRFIDNFSKNGLTLRGSYQPGHELNEPQNLLKHILSDEGTYTNRVKMIAWKQLFKEMEHRISTDIDDMELFGEANSTCSFKMFDADGLDRSFAPVVKRLKKEGLGQSNLIEWLDNANGVFESFELDCTLHNLDATDFLPVILTSRPYYKMAEALVDFQDDETRSKLFKTLAENMISFK